MRRPDAEVELQQVDPVEVAVYSRFVAIQLPVIERVPREVEVRRANLRLPRVDDWKRSEEHAGISRLTYEIGAHEWRQIGEVVHVRDRGRDEFGEVRRILPDGIMLILAVDGDLNTVSCRIHDRRAHEEGAGAMPFRSFSPAPVSIFGIAIEKIRPWFENIAPNSVRRGVYEGDHRQNS